MESNVNLRIKLPTEVIEAAGVNEDCIFESYFEDGIIHVKIYDEEDMDSENDDESDEECDEENEIDELFEFLNALPPDLQREAFFHLSVKLTSMLGATPNA